MDVGKDFVKNGFIVRSYEGMSQKPADNYYGGKQYFTWPLDVCTDIVSRKLVEEALERWFGYQDNRLHVVPDVDYLSRYVEHCKKLNIQVVCFLIESQNRIITTEAVLPIRRVLGYDYVDVDMCTSCLYDELNQDNLDNLADYENIQESLNMYGLFSSMDEMMNFLYKRDELIKDTRGEEYYNLTIVKVSEVMLH